MSDIFNIENIGYISVIYIMDIYHNNPAVFIRLLDQRHI